MTDATRSVDLAGAWQGVDHITLVTGDLDATVVFYRDVLEMPVVFEAPSNPHHGRHAMISPGGPGMGLHFFELAGAQVLPASRARLFFFQDPSGLLLKATWLRTGDTQPQARPLVPENADCSTRRERPECAI